MILLDTCTFLWLMLDPDKLSKKAREVIEHDSQTLHLSSISALEIGMLLKKKRISLPLPTAEWLEKSREFLDLREIPMNDSIAISATELPQHHKDPADRIIIATAKVNKLKILSPDKHIKSYKEAKVIW